MEINFEVKGKVKAKQSVKFGKNGIKFTPRDIVEYANLVKLSFINKYPDWDINNSPMPFEFVCCSVIFNPLSFL